jgi:pimeloyl-ACP methyl ester carboxylesterase
MQAPDADHADASREEPIRFAGPACDIAGTLTLPAGSGPFPAAVLLSGSGPLDRDSNHRKIRFDVSRQVAAALADAGLASLRFDKRGVGETPGDWKATGFYDNVDDAAAALAALRARPEVADDALYVIGHSEGAMLATALAGRGVQLAGLVLLAGAARSGEKVLLWQTRAIVPTLPKPIRLLLRLLRVDPVKKVAANHAKIKATTTDVARMGLARMNARWLREFMAYEPARDLERIDVPVLAITGDKDLQSPPEDLPALQRAGHGWVATHLVADLTHILRREEDAPSLGKYKREAKQPVDDRVLKLVTHWLTRSR